MAKRNPVGRPTPVPVTGQQFEMLEIALMQLVSSDWKWARAVRGFAKNANMPRVLQIVDALESANINAQGGLVFDEPHEGIKIVKKADEMFANRGRAVSRHAERRAE